MGSREKSRGSTHQQNAEHREMDSVSLAVSLDLVASTGNVLSVEHKAAMQSSLPLLKKNYKFSQVVFWGKIQGRSNDYLVAQGINNSWMGSKKTFYCQDGVTWAQLPEPDEELKANCAKLPAGTPLTGEPSYVYTIAAPKPEGEEEAEEPAETEDASIKFAEDRRLAVVIDMVDKANAMVPKGALMSLSTGDVVENRSWTGLDPVAAA